MIKNSIEIQCQNNSYNGKSAMIKVYVYRDNKFHCIYGWIIENITLDSNNKTVINLDPNDYLKGLEPLQDTLPFGTTISVEFPLGTKPVYISDIYHTSMSETLEIINRHNLDVSTNNITDLRIEDNLIVASFRGTNSGDFELYEISNGNNINTAVINQVYRTKINTGSIRLDIHLDNNIDPDANIIGRWRTTGENLFSGYINARKIHMLKYAVIERHEIKAGKLILYLYDRDTLGAFNESGLLIRATKGTDTFVVSGTVTIMPTRTAITLETTDTDRIVGLTGTVKLTAEVIGSPINSNTYNFDTNSILPPAPGPGTPSGKYFILNADKVAYDKDNRMLYTVFDSSHDAVIEYLKIEDNADITVDQSSYNLTDRQLNIKPSVGVWVKTTKFSWDKKLRYTYRIKGKANKTEEILLSSELPELKMTVEQYSDKIKLLFKFTQRGEHQSFIIKDITGYDAGNNVVWSGIPNQTIDIIPEVTIPITGIVNMTKVMFKYNFAGKPFSSVKTTTDITIK